MRLRGIGYASTASLMFGLGVVLAKLLSGEIDATVVAMLALSIGGLLLAACLFLIGIPFLRLLASLKPTAWLQISLLACPGTALPLLLIVARFARTSALEGGLLLQLNGLAAMLFAVLLLGERIKSTQGLGILFLLAGGVLIVVGGTASGVASGWSGDLFILMGALGLGFGFVPAKRLADHIDPLTLSALRLLIGAACIVPVLAVQLFIQKGALLWRPSVTSLWALPLYIVTNFCLAYLIQQAGFGLLKAWEMAAILQSVPLFSTTFAVLMLGDTITLLQGIRGQPRYVQKRPQLNHKQRAASFCLLHVAVWSLILPRDGPLPFQRHHRASPLLEDDVLGSFMGPPAQEALPSPLLLPRLVPHVAGCAQTGWSAPPR